MLSAQRGNCCCNSILANKGLQEVVLGCLVDARCCWCLRPNNRPVLVQAVFLLIGKTSALTMNIAGVIKDW